MKTAIQQAMQTLEELKAGSAKSPHDFELMSKINELLAAYLPIEEIQIIKACIHGADNECGFGVNQAKEYYKATFND